MSSRSHETGPETDQSAVQDAVRHGSSIIVDVVELSIGDLDDSLVDNVLIGAGEEEGASESGPAGRDLSTLTGCRT